MRALKDNKSNQPRLNKKRCQSGMDEMELALTLENIEHLYLPKEELKNNAGNTIVSMECVHGVVKAYVNAVHGVRSDNVKPYGCLGELNEIKLGIVEARVMLTQLSNRGWKGHKPNGYVLWCAAKSGSVRKEVCRVCLRNIGVKKFALA